MKMNSLTHNFTQSLLKKCCGAGLLLSVMLNQSFALDTAPGLTPAEFAVGPSGSAEYNVPITVPPGTAGMQPSLSLNYSSMNGNGVMGVGWALSGTSAITRCAQTIAQDGEIRAVKFDAQDKLCLDGQRLIAVDGTYGAVGTVYRKEIDDFSRIVSIGGTLGNPNGFQVSTKAGQIVQYGYTDDSRIPVSAGNSTNRVWSVNKISDTLGNYIEFIYVIDPDAEDYRLIEIAYTGNDQVSPVQPTYSSVIFEYEPRSIQKFAYVNGFRYTQRQQLTSIKTLHDNNLVRRYNLSYLPEVTTSVEQIRLEKIQECSDEACFEPLVFDWEPGNQGPSLSGDTLTLNIEAEGVGFTDINGDGKTDFCRIEGLDGNGHIACNLGGPNGFTTTMVRSSNAYDRGFDEGGREWADFNGDGLADFCRLVGSNSDQRVSCLLSSGTNAFAGQVTSVSGALTSGGGWGHEEGRSWVDKNGDGRADYCRTVSTNRLSCLLSEGNSFGQEITQIVSLNVTGGDWKDIDNDGLTDFCKGPSCIKGTTNGWESDIIILPESEGNTFAGPIKSLVDINGDGNEDVCSSDVIFENVASYNVETTQNGYPYYDNYQEINYDGDKFITPFSGNINTLDSYVKATFTFNCQFNTGNEILSDEVPVFTHEVYAQGEYYPGSASEPLIFGAVMNAVDRNNDGLGDICLFTKYSKNLGAVPTTPTGHFRMCAYSNGVGFTQKTGEVSDSEYFRTANEGTHVDFNGDALADDCRINQPDKTEPIIDISCNYGQTRPSQRIEKFTDSLGNQTIVDYKRLTDTSAYTKDSASNSAVDPYMDLQAPFYVVTQVQTSNGIGGTNTLTYRYGGAKMHREGRGFQGFRWMRLTDHQSGLITATYYSQAFPYTGMVTSTATYQDDGETLIKWVRSNLRHTQTAYGTYFSYVKTSYQTDYDLNDGSPIKTVQTHYGDYDGENGNDNSIDDTYDEFGNALKVTVLTRYGDFSSPTGQSVIITENTYDDDETKWHLGRLTRTRVTKSNEDGDSVLRISDFAYDTITGLLVQEVEEPGNELYQKVTDYQYDLFGNITHVTVTGGSTGQTDVFGQQISVDTSIESRTTETNYNADGLNPYHIRGQFPISVINAENEEEKHSYDARYGVMTSLTGPNGLTTVWRYDSFGRQYREERADNTWTRTIRVHASDRATSPENAKLVVETHTDGQPVSAEYSDSLGRVIMARVQGPVRSSNGFGNRDIVSETEYNALGQVSRQSLPYYDGASKRWKSYTYDDLGRIKSENEPRENQTTVTVSYDYDGLRTIATDRKGNTTEQRSNARGELVEAKDDNGKSTFYEYDASGNQVRMIDAVGNTTRIQYNILGQKIGMQDPDMGEWIYNHDVLGQLVYQKDAKDQVTTMVYDKVGRMTQRVDQECTSFWVYGTTNNQNKSYEGFGIDDGTLTNAKSIGKLVYSQRGTTERVFTEYDSLGRPVRVTQELFGGIRKYTTRTSYDEYSRVETITYPASSDFPSGLVVTNQYDDKNYLYKVTGPNNTIFWEFEDQDAFGNIRKYKLSNGNLLTQKVFNDYTGLIESVTTTKLYGTQQTVQQDSFGFDEQGNLTNRSWVHVAANSTRAETFTYDGLNRVRTAHSAINGTQNFDYNDIGNITFKSGVGTYTYGQNGAGPHAVTSTSFGNKTYTYDDNGNMETGDGRTITWSVYNKPLSITKGTNYSNFVYGVDRQRVRQINESKTIYYAGGLFEEEVENSTTTYVHYIKAAGQTVATVKSYDDGSNLELRYLLKDHLGSITAVTDQQGSLLEQFSFDVFGKRRNLDGTDASDTIDTETLVRGFTGHEHLDNVGIIHMNGRVYDPHLGRFMSADPHIQSPTDSQSLNRYSYVMNNPLSMTDPSGFFFKSLFKIAFTIAVSYFTAGIATALGASPFWSVVLGGFTGGLAASGGNLKMGIIGAFSAGATFGIGSYFERFESIAGTNLPGALSKTTVSIMKTVAHGVVQGITNKLQGGKFISGWYSAGFSRLVSNIPGFSSGGEGRSLLDAIKSAIVGGTAAVIGGGKFANGAMSAAFITMFNDQMHRGNRSPKANTQENKTMGNDPELKFLGEVNGRGDSLTVDAGTEIFVEPYGHSLGGEVFSYDVNYHLYDGEGNLLPNMEPLNLFGKPIPWRSEQAIVGQTGGGPDRIFVAPRSHGRFYNTVRWTISIPRQASTHDNSMGVNLRIYEIVK